MVRGFLVVLVAIFGLFCTLSGTPARGQDAPQNDQGRVSFHKVDEGLHSRDNRRGQV